MIVEYRIRGNFGKSSYYLAKHKEKCFDELNIGDLDKIILYTHIIAVRSKF